MHTEQQASLLWCPMVRQTSPEHNGSWNRGNQSTESNSMGGNYHCCCITTQCMGWRWAKPPILKRFFHVDVAEAVRRPGSNRDFLERIQYERPPYKDDSPQADKEHTFAEVVDMHLQAIKKTDAVFIAHAFQLPEGAGWEFEMADVVEDEGTIVVTHARECDPTATGFCGYATKPGAQS